VLFPDEDSQIHHDKSNQRHHFKRQLDPLAGGNRGFSTSGFRRGASLPCHFHKDNEKSNIFWGLEPKRRHHFGFGQSFALSSSSSSSSPSSSSSTQVAAVAVPVAVSVAVPVTQSSSFCPPNIVGDETSITAAVSPAREFIFEQFLGRGGFGATFKARADPVRHFLPNSGAYFCVVAFFFFFFLLLSFFFLSFSFSFSLSFELFWLHKEKKNKKKKQKKKKKKKTKGKNCAMPNPT
jgi:hypothetical protein